MPPFEVENLSELTESGETACAMAHLLLPFIHLSCDTAGFFGLRN
jgi:hypothetical protein